MATETAPGWRSRIVGHGEADPAALTSNPRNWRTHPRPQLDALAGVLAEVGWVQDVILNRTTGHVVDGHARIQLALTRKEPAVPVVYVELTPEEEAKVLATFDPVGAMAGADPERLAALVREVTTDDAALRGVVQALADEHGIDLGGGGEAPEAPEPEVDRAEELRAKWGTAPGQLWVIGRHRLLCGDTTREEDVARVLAGQRAAFSFTSPPYAVGLDYGLYEDTIENLRRLLDGLVRALTAALADGAFCVINFGDIVSGRAIVGTEEVCQFPMALEYWPRFRAAGWTLHTERIWVKPIGATVCPWTASSSRGSTEWEHLWTWKRPGPDRSTRSSLSQFGVWHYSRFEYETKVTERHPGAFPVYIVRGGIEVYSHPGDLVFEPFAGSGTGLVAAEQTGRRCAGLDIDPRYVAVTLERLSQMGLEPRLEA